jgi:hypothetical protein
MNKPTEINCLNRLFELTGTYVELVDFLFNEKIMDINEKNRVKIEVEKASFLLNIIHKAQKRDAILLATFDWIMLPEERIRLQIITERTNQSFVFNW